MTSGTAPRHSAARRGARPSMPPPAANASRRSPSVITLDVSRSSRAATALAVVIVVLLLIYGVYRAAAIDRPSGLGLIGLAAVLAVPLAVRLRPDRLLRLRVSPREVCLTSAWRADVVIGRTFALRAVLWVGRPYQGAEPILRGLYLVDGDGVKAFCRPRGFDLHGLQQFFAAGAIPTELVDAGDAPLSDPRQAK